MFHPNVAFVTDLHISEDSIEDWAYTSYSIIRSVPKDTKLILLGGDYCGHKVPHRPSPVERNAFSLFVIALAEIAPVVVIRGNHDNKGEFAMLPRLKAQYPIFYYETVGIRALSKERGHGVDALVVALPWIDFGDTDAESHDDYAAFVAKRYTSTIDAAIAHRDEKMPSAPIFCVAHAAVNGAILREGQPTVPTSDPVIAPSVICRDEVAATFIGHYHAPQNVSRNSHKDVNGVYGGSATISQYGEVPAKVLTVYRENRTQIVPIWGRPRVLLEVDIDGDTVKIKGVCAKLDGSTVDFPIESLSDTVGHLFEPYTSVEPPNGRDPAPGAMVKLRVKSASALTESGEHSLQKVRAWIQRLIANFPGAEFAPTEYVLGVHRRERSGGASVVAGATLEDKFAAWTDANAGSIDPAHADAARNMLPKILSEIDK